MATTVADQPPLTLMGQPSNAALEAKLDAIDKRLDAIDEGLLELTASLGIFAAKIGNNAVPLDELLRLVAGRRKKRRRRV